MKVASPCCSSLWKFSALLSCLMKSWKKRSKSLHNDLIWLQWSDWRLAMHPAGAQWASVAVDWPPAAWTPSCGRTKREFTLFPWICIVLLPLDTKVITQVYWALNNGLIDGTLIIGGKVYLLGLLAVASRLQNTEKNSLHIFIYMRTSSAHCEQPFSLK